MRTLVTAVVVLALVAACGNTAPTATPTATPPAATPGPSEPVAQAACPDKPEPTGTPCFEVVIHDFAFDPASLRVPTTARVVFKNTDGVAHSIKWADGTPTTPALTTGATAQREFSGAQPATIAYICGIHGASMSGEIVIDASLPIP